MGGSAPTAGPLPTREPSQVLTPLGSETADGPKHELLPSNLVREMVDDFTAPRLRFEFTFPGFVEELNADHITTVGIPRESPYDTDPVGDITEPDHRDVVQTEPDEGLIDRVVEVVSVLLGRSDGELDAGDPNERDAVAPNDSNHNSSVRALSLVVSDRMIPLIPLDKACLGSDDDVVVLRTA